MIRFCLFTVLTVLVWQVGFSATSPMIQNNAFIYIAAPQDNASHTVMLGGYRAYNPKTGEFLKQDSDTPFLSRKTLNGFDYAAGNPVMKMDPTGHLPQRTGKNILVRDEISTGVIFVLARIAYKYRQVLPIIGSPLYSALRLIGSRIYRTFRPLPMGRPPADVNVARRVAAEDQFVDGITPSEAGSVSRHGGFVQPDRSDVESVSFNSEVGVSQLIPPDPRARPTETFMPTSPDDLAMLDMS